MWLEWFEISQDDQERHLAENKGPIEEEFGVEITSTGQDFVAVKGTRKAVAYACERIISTCNLNYPPTDDGKRLQEERTRLQNGKQAPKRIWPIGHVWQALDVNPDNHGLVVGAGGMTVESMRSRHKVNIYVPHRNELYKSIDIVGRKENVEMAKREILQLLSRYEKKHNQTPPSNNTTHQE